MRTSWNATEGGRGAEGLAGLHGRPGGDVMSPLLLFVGIMEARDQRPHILAEPIMQDHCCVALPHATERGAPGDRGHVADPRGEVVVGQLPMSVAEPGDLE